MPKSKSGRKKQLKRVLALPDLEQTKAAVLHSLTSTSGQRTYDHAIREFVAWHCSEPRLAFNRTVVLRYRIHLEQRHYAPATINLRLAAVRRIAYGAADVGCIESWQSTRGQRCSATSRVGAHLQLDDVAVYDLVQGHDVQCLSRRLPAWNQVRQAISIACRAYGPSAAIKLIATPAYTEPLRVTAAGEEGIMQTQFGRTRRSTTGSADTVH